MINLRHIEVFYAVMRAGGHGHVGLTAAAPGADIIAALLAGRKPSIETAPYSPARF